jgi:prevent-host-death family protein
MPWQMQEAKQKFCELVRRALDEGPQVVTRRGQEVVVVIAAEEFRRLTPSAPDFKEFLLSGQDLSAMQLECVRLSDLPREIKP